MGLWEGPPEQPAIASVNVLQGLKIAGKLQRADWVPRLITLREARATMEASEDKYEEVHALGRHRCHARSIYHAELDAVDLKQGLLHCGKIEI